MTQRPTLARVVSFSLGFFIMAVTPSTLTASDSTPADELALWEPAAIIQPDWSDVLEVESVWHTDIRTARSTAEQRRIRRERPRLNLTTPLPAIKRDDLMHAAMRIQRTTDARSLAPLWVDMTKLSSAVSSSATTLNCDTTYRRFFQGARVLIIETTNDTIPTTWEVATIDSLTASSITIASGLTNGYTAAARVVPLIEAEVGLSQSGNIITARAGRLPWIALERVGPMSLEPAAAVGSNPTGFDTHDGLPIFALEHVDWSDGLTLGFQRPGELSELGLAEVPDVHGDWAAMSVTVPVVALSREDAWAVKRLFDSRAGRAYPFWFCSPFTYELDAVSSTTRIDVDAAGVSADWNRRPYLYVVETDGTAHVRQIDSVTRVNGIDRVTLTSAISPQLNDEDIRVVGWAILARFGSDALKERWVTDRTMLSELQVVELLNEKDVTITDLDDLTTAATPDPDVEQLDWDSNPTAQYAVRLSGQDSVPCFQYYFGSPPEYMSTGDLTGLVNVIHYLDPVVGDPNQHRVRVSGGNPPFQYYAQPYSDALCSNPIPVPAWWEANVQVWTPTGDPSKVIVWIQAPDLDGSFLSAWFAHGGSGSAADYRDIAAGQKISIPNQVSAGVYSSNTSDPNFPDLYFPPNFTSWAGGTGGVTQGGTIEIWRRPQ